MLRVTIILRAQYRKLVKLPRGYLKIAYTYSIFKSILNLGPLKEAKGLPVAWADSPTYLFVTTVLPIKLFDESILP